MNKAIQEVSEEVDKKFGLLEADLKTKEDLLKKNQTGVAEEITKLKE